jgi:hypothetical protein
MATALLTYLLQANGVLLLVAAAYYGLLRRLTFFSLNRAYLAGALLFAAVYPVLPVPALLPAARLLPAASLLPASPVTAASPGDLVGTDWLALGPASRYPRGRRGSRRLPGWPWGWRATHWGRRCCCCACWPSC